MGFIYGLSLQVVVEDKIGIEAMIAPTLLVNWGCFRYSWIVGFERAVAGDKRIVDGIGPGGTHDIFGRGCATIKSPYRPFLEFLTKKLDPFRNFCA